MLDPLVSLAFSVHNSKGVYAALLGSGISTAAGIPTGWGIVLDLIRKIATAHGESCEPHPDAWFRRKFNEPPGYSRLLDLLGKTPAERHSFLKGYIEPSEEERERGQKVPTRAHLALARLVASGHVRLILTLNFDRLIEVALESVGISPTIIASPDAVAGATPLTHSSCTVVKLHGDYLDTRIKNTPEELAKYHPRINRLLDRVLNEYGLIVCGWSADWDTALRVAFERCPNRRYTTYWAARGKPSEKAQGLITLRHAEMIPITGADAFFEGLAEKVAALEAFARPHPLSKAIVVANTKKYLAEPRFRIQLHDLVTQEADRLVDQISPGRLPGVEQPVRDAVWEWMQWYEGLTEILAAVMATGCYWSEGEQNGMWPKLLGRVANAEQPDLSSYYPAAENLENLRYYPALLLLYAGGLAATARHNYGLIKALLTDVKIRVRRDQEWSALDFLMTWFVLEGDLAKELPGLEGHSTALSDRLRNVLREPLREYLPDETEYDNCFDRFEYLRSLLNFDKSDWRHSRGRRCAGRFYWRRSSGHDVLREIQQEIKHLGKDWPPLKVGWFDGDLSLLEIIRSLHDQNVGENYLP